jgi:hypothetical protein
MAETAIAITTLDTIPIVPTFALFPHIRNIRRWQTKSRKKLPAF